MKSRSRPQAAGLIVLCLTLLCLIIPQHSRAGGSLLFDLIKAYSIYQKGRVLFGGKKVAADIGRSVDRAVRKQYGVETDQHLNAWVSSVFANVTDAIPPGWPYTCTIIKADFVNAMAVPGGYIYVTKPFLEFVQTDDELASVLAHEAAHIIHNHGMDMAKRNIALGTIMEAALKDETDYRNEINLMYNLFMLRYSRDNEYEADITGLGITARAGYNPLGMTDFLKRMLAKEKDEGNRPFEWLSTHPTTDGRIHKVRSEIYLNRHDLSKPMYMSYAELDPNRLPGNLLPNGGFEQMTGEAGVPTGWKVPKGTARIITDDVYTGDSALMCGENVASTLVESPPVAITAECTYRIRGLVKFRSSGNLSIHAPFFDKEGHMLSVFSVRPETTEHRAGWKLFDVRFGTGNKKKEKSGKKTGKSAREETPVSVLTDGTTVEIFSIPEDAQRMQINIVITGPPADTVLFDELYIGQWREQPAKQNLLVNPGFEFDHDRDGLPEGWSFDPGAAVDRSQALEGYTSIRITGQELQSPLARKLAAYRKTMRDIPLGGKGITISSKPVPVTDEDDYVIGIHSLGGATTETFELRVYLLDESNAIIPGLGERAVFTTTGYWQLHCCRLHDLGVPAYAKLPPERTPTTLQVTVKTSMPNGHTIWFDSFFVRTAPLVVKPQDIMFTPQP